MAQVSEEAVVGFIVGLVLEDVLDVDGRVLGQDGGVAGEQVPRVDACLVLGDCVFDLLESVLFEREGLGVIEGIEYFLFD